MTGVVKNIQPNFGFIHADGGGDYFFHRGDAPGLFTTLVEGDRVQFQAMEPEPDRGPRALRVAIPTEGVALPTEGERADHMTGVVKTVYRSYAFIRSNEGKDFFVLFSDVEDFLTLIEGDRVQFEAMEPAPERGPRAVRVALLAGGAE